MTKDDFPLVLALQILAKQSQNPKQFQTLEINRQLQNQATSRTCFKDA